MNQLIKFVIIFCVFVCYSKEGMSQAPGSSNTENSSRYIGGTRSTLAETLYIGPNAHIVIEGTWLIYSKNIVIDPSAIIEGTGTIEIHNPDQVGGIASTTSIDGNGSRNALEVNVELYNAQGMEIKNIDFPTELLASDFTNNPSSSSLYIGKDLSLEVDGADVTLDPTVQGDLIFDANATISNYRPERMIVTNNRIVSHVIKEDLAGEFIFPVGISKRDYTPAMLTGNETLHVSVQDYAQSIANEGLLTGGPDRTWHIFADNAATVTMALQHNVETDVAVFVSTQAHYVTQYNSTAWSSTTPESGLTGTFTTGTSPIAGASTQDLTGVVLSSSGTDATSYFTKATIQSALPVTLVTFEASRIESSVQLNWSTVDEEQSALFEVERSTDMHQWYSIGQRKAATTSNILLHYQFVDSAALEGNSYYRLKMIDHDRSFTYSDIVSIVINRSEVELSIYPNPTAERFYLAYVEPSAIKSIRLLTATGSLLQTLSHIPANGIQINGLPSGVYIVQVLLQNGQSITRKLTIQL